METQKIEIPFKNPPFKLVKLEIPLQDRIEALTLMERHGKLIISIRSFLKYFKEYISQSELYRMFDEGKLDRLNANGTVKMDNSKSKVYIDLYRWLAPNPSINKPPRKPRHIYIGKGDKLRKS